MTTSIPEPITPYLTTELTVAQEQTTFATTDELDVTTKNNLDTTTIAGETSTAKRTTEVIKSTTDMTAETASTTEEVTSIDETSKTTTSESSSTGESSTTIGTTKPNTKILTTTTADTTVPDTTTLESQSTNLETEEMSTTTPAMSYSTKNVTSTIPPWAGESTTVLTKKQIDSTTTSPEVTTPTAALQTSSLGATTVADSTITITTTAITTTAITTSATNGYVICRSEDNDNNCIMSIKGCSITFEGAYNNAYDNIDSVESENLRRHLDPLITKSISTNSTFVWLKAIITEITDALNSKIDVIVTIEPVAAGTLIDNDTKIEIKDYLESKQWFDEMNSLWIQELASNQEFKIWTDEAGFKGVYNPDFQVVTTSAMNTATTTSSGPVTQMTTSTLVSIKSTSTPTTGADSLSNLNAILEFEGDYIEEYKNVDSDEFKQFEALMNPILYESIGDLSTRRINFELVRLSKGSIIAEFNITARNADLDNLGRLIGNDEESCGAFIQQSGSKCWESYINDLLSTANENNQQVPESLKNIIIPAASDNDDVTFPTPSSTSSSVATTTTTKSSTTTIVTTSTSSTDNSTTTATITTSITTTSAILSTTTAERPSELFNLTLYSEGDTHDISFNVKADEDYIERAISERNNFIDENPDANIYLSVVRKVSFPYITVGSMLKFFYSEVCSD